MSSNKKYWEGRSVQREIESQIIVSKYLTKMEESLREAQHDILRQIESFYSKYANENQISIAEAKRYLTPNELRDFKNIDLKRFREMSLSRNPEYDRILNAVSYRVRISRLEALNLQIEMRMAELFSGVNGLQEYTYTGLVDVYQNSYYKTMFDLTKNGVMAGTVIALSDETMQEVLSYNWSGKEFSERIWGHQESTRRAIRKELERSFASGRSIQKTTKAIMDVTEVTLSRAEALVRTEANFFHNAATQKSYSDAGIERYEILATLDSRTSDICRHQDGKIYAEKDYKPGETAPPFHVRCRTTTIPYFDEEEYMGGEKRQSAEGLIDTISYEEWYEKYVKDDSQKVVAEKMNLNKAADKRQYGNYKEILGKEVPRSFAAFQEIKYNNPNKYTELKSLYREVIWQVKAQENLITGNVHKVEFIGPPNSVFDNYKEGILDSRRYYGPTGKPRLDIDFSDHGNSKNHPVVPHAHDWLKKENIDKVNREKKWRPLSKAEKIANQNVIRKE